MDARARLGSRVVYGAIVGLAVVVALQAHPPAAGVIAATIVATAVAVALAELYSELVTVRETSGRSVREAVGVGLGAAFPAVFFLLEALGALGEEAAFTLAKWTGVAMIGGYGYIAARRAGNSATSAVLQALGIAAVGAVLIGFKSLVH
jgi:hypothetical protein